MEVSKNLYDSLNAVQNAKMQTMDIVNEYKNSGFKTFDEYIKFKIKGPLPDVKNVNWDDFFNEDSDGKTKI